MLLAQIEWLISEALGLVGNFFLNTLKYGFLFSVIGVIAGVYLYRFAKKKGLLQRMTRTWTGLTRIYVAYIPFVLAFMLGSMGGNFGVQRSVNKWINASTEPVIDYAVNYIPQLQKLGVHLDAQLTLEEALMQLIYQQQSQNQSIPDDPRVKQMLLLFNKTIVHAFLDELGYPRNIDGLIKLVRGTGLAKISESTLQGIPRSLRKEVGKFFVPIYWGIFMTFLPFLLLPLVEWGIHWLINRSNPLPETQEK